MATVLDYVSKDTNSDGELTVNASQHYHAVLTGRTNKHGKAIISMLLAWENYARAFKESYDQKIGTDGVIGRYWAETGLAIKRLLDGETGGLDCGSIAANITRIIQEQGFQTDGYSLT